MTFLETTPGQTALVAPSRRLDQAPHPGTCPLRLVGSQTGLTALPSRPGEKGLPGGNDQKQQVRGNRTREEEQETKLNTKQRDSEGHHVGMRFSPSGTCDRTCS